MKPKIAIVGAGPAGTSLAVRLAVNDFPVTLIEREKFPRHKLCGEFISPEGLAHFKALGVLDEMLAAGGDRITETRFFAMNGKSIGVPSSWFAGGSALSLSRAEMDLRMIQRAQACGVEVMEESRVVGLEADRKKVNAVKVRTSGRNEIDVTADLFIDATGRAGILAKLLTKKTRTTIPKSRPILVAFKTHVSGVDIEPGCCEIYSFPGGYGGLSNVEKNLANHCFLIKSEAARPFGSDTDRLVEQLIFQNRRAAQTLRHAQPVGSWLAVSIDGFGSKNLVQASNVLSVGDAAAFMDPFTGSGMLMAMESSEILSKCIDSSDSFESVGARYRTMYRDRFAARMRVGSILRFAAFSPKLAGLVISGFGTSRALRSLVARSTRPNTL